MKQQILTLDISDITIDDEINIREVLDPDTVERYVAMREFTPPPPVVVFGPENLLSDGFHRVHSAMEDPDSDGTIPAIRMPGGVAEAMEWAVTANVAHGKPLTPAERKAGAIRLMDAHPDWTVRQVAQAVAMHHTTVVNIHQEQTVLARLSEETQKRVKTEKRTRKGKKTDQPVVTPTHLYRVAQLPEEAQESAVQAILENEWTEPQTRDVIDAAKTAMEDAADPAAAAIDTVEHAVAMPVFDRRALENVLGPNGQYILSHFLASPDTRALFDMEPDELASDLTQGRRESALEALIEVRQELRRVDMHLSAVIARLEHPVLEAVK